MKRKKKKKAEARSNLKRKVNSGSKPVPVTAAGGIVYRKYNDSDEPEVLMIFRNGVWDLPKGKHEPGETIEMCAAREVSEETGSGLPAIINKTGETYHEYPESGKLMGKTTHWYSMIFTKQEKLKPQKEEGIKKIAWMPLTKAIDEAGYENLKQILGKFR